MSNAERRAASDLPKATEVLAEIASGIALGEVSQPERLYAERFAQSSVEQQVRYAHFAGIRDHYKHKGRWSIFLIAAIAGMLLFQSYLLFKVGTGDWDFSKYEWLLPALLVQNLAQVVGLSVWAVKYLFSDISRQKPD